ncbi:MAG: amidohydrolase family protein [Deltaproteobacteria bacterium]|nr:amidohydrolase family protein [Deltaproteobacteria bacterium]
MRSSPKTPKRTIPTAPLRAVVMSLGALVLCACGQGPAPDRIFHGGPIRTLNERGEVAEAIAIREGAIVAIGTARDVLALAGARTQVEDLGGRALLPGFVAVHEHPTLSAIFGGVADMSGLTHSTSAEVWAALRTAVGAARKGDWVYAMGIDPILVPDLEMPTRRSLDAIAPDNPVVVVSQTMHSFWANSRAFAEAGIGRDTADPGRVREGSASVRNDPRGWR